MEANRCSGITTDINLFRNIIDGFKPKQFQGWQYDLSLGAEYYTTTLDLPQGLSEDKPYAIIRPGDFALLITEERLNMPLDAMAFISIKFTYKQKGLINISGFHVDPGYTGKIIFSAYNAGPNDIVLKKGEPVFMIFFQMLDKRLEKTSSTTKLENIPASMVSAIRGKSISLASNAVRIDRVEFYFKFYGAIAVSIIIVLFSLLVRAASGG